MDYTVGDLRGALAGLSDGTKISIAGNLHVYRLKHIADDEVFLEFDEFEAEISQKFRKKFPNIQVIFCNHDLSDNVVEEVLVPRL